MIEPVLALLQEEAAGSDAAPLVGGLILAVGATDLVIAFYLGFVKRPPNASEKARRVLPMALAAAGLFMCVLGAVVLTGVVPI